MVNDTASIIDIDIETQPADGNAEILPASPRKFPIPGDAIHRATASLPDEQRDLLRWFAGHCRSENLGKDQLVRLLKKSDGSYYSYDAIYQTLTGKRTAAGLSIEPICSAIASLRRIAEERREQVTSGFIETRLFQIISARARKALLRKKICPLFGESQIGKSDSLKEYQRRNNHGETVYIETPCGGHLGNFLAELAASLGIPPQQRVTSLRSRIIESFDDRMLLIVDEFHNALRSPSGQIPAFLRELYNRARCGMVLAMTNEGRDLIHHGPQAQALRQLWNRRITPLQLPSVPPRDDLDKFAAAYGLSPAPDEEIGVVMTVIDDQGHDRRKEHRDNPLRLQTHVLRTEGLGVWITILQDASDIARESKRSISWGAVIKAYCMSQADAEVIK